MNTDTVELAAIAETYVPIDAQITFEKEVVRRLERIEDKLDRAAAAKGMA